MCKEGEALKVSLEKANERKSIEKLIMNLFKRRSFEHLKYKISCSNDTLGLLLAVVNLETAKLKENHQTDSNQTQTK
jgi:hypothetical protein